MSMVRAKDIYVAVTHTSHTLDNTGIQRVTRSLCRALELDYPAATCVSWNESLRSLTPLDSAQAHRMAAYFGPQNVEPRTDVSVAPTWISHLPVPRVMRRRIREAWRRRNAHFRFRKGAYLVIPEWVTGEQMWDLIHFARRKHLRTVAIFHDAIAIDHPDLVSSKYRQYHLDYLLAMTHCDLVIANSSDSYERFKRFVREHPEGQPQIDYVELAGEIPGTQRNMDRLVMDLDHPIRALCVGSLDPRKNHQRLIEAFEGIWDAHPDLPLELILVGGQYDASSDLSCWVESKVRQRKRLIWMGRITDEALAQQYADCHFTCFPSLVEGFGIPLLESLWKGRPCLCSDRGIVGDLAKEGGCITCEVTEVSSIRKAIESVLFQKGLYENLCEQATARPIKTWRQFGREFVAKLTQHLP
ncbi:MAG: glycosyltransferase [Puniceicoccaceae bacterium]